MAKSKYPFTNTYITTTGNLTRDPKKFGGGDNVTVSLRIAVKFEGRGRDEGVYDDSKFFNVLLFGRKGERAYEEFRKGDRVKITDGELYLDYYDNKDGEEVQDMMIKIGLGSADISRDITFASNGGGSRRTRNDDDHDDQYNDDDDDEEMIEDEYDEEPAPRARSSRSGGRSSGRSSGRSGGRSGGRSSGRSRSVKNDVDEDYTSDV